MDILISYANKYKDLYTQDINSVFHIACGCVCGQQVAFGIGRGIRKQLYETCGSPLTPEAILEADLTLIKNLTPKRATLLVQMAKIDDLRSVKRVLKDYSKLSGFGTWSVGAVSILSGISDTINLSSDAYIRKNLSLYTGEKMTERKCYDYILTAEENQTVVCYLLWRIKPQSINKLNRNKKLTADDFV